MFDLELKKFLSTVDFRFFWSYEGSLTTPPCTENIQWTVVDLPMPMSQEQFDIFQSKYATNPDFANGNSNLRAP